MFSKVLIANRGEAAVRIIRTCKVLGIQTVAVFSDVDQQSLHVKLADESYSLGPPSPEESYSDGEKALAAAKKAAVDAIHPGYGYLSENPSFAAACDEAGVKFVGPSPQTLEITENKIECRKLARRVGVPTLPGTDEILHDVEEALRFADEIGYPVILKSAFGGGGRDTGGHEEVGAERPVCEGKPRSGGNFRKGWTLRREADQAREAYRVAVHL